MQLLVSVVMSVHNDAAFLPEAIESILDQDFRHFEFIIINDGSTDDATQRIIESYRDERIVACTQQRHGLTRSLNQGLQMARGRYIARQDADDISLPGRLSKEVAFLETRTDVALIGTGIVLISERGALLRQYLYPQNHAALRQQLLRVVNPFPHSSVMYRRDVVLGQGGYDERFYRSEDYALYLRLTEQHQCSTIREPLVKIRYRSHSVTYRDHEAHQIKNAILARALVSVRQNTSSDADRLSQQEPFRTEYDRWFAASRLARRFNLLKSRRQWQQMWYSRDYRGCLRLLTAWLRHEPASLIWWRPANFWNATMEKDILDIARRCRST